MNIANITVVSDTSQMQGLTAEVKTIEKLY